MFERFLGRASVGEEQVVVFFVCCVLLCFFFEAGGVVDGLVDQVVEHERHGAGAGGGVVLGFGRSIDLQVVERRDAVYDARLVSFDHVDQHRHFVRSGSAG